MPRAISLNRVGLRDRRKAKSPGVSEPRQPDEILSRTGLTACISVLGNLQLRNVFDSGSRSHAGKGAVRRELGVPRSVLLSEVSRSLAVAGELLLPAQAPNLTSLLDPVRVSIEIRPPFRSKGSSRRRDCTLDACRTY